MKIFNKGKGTSFSLAAIFAAAAIFPASAHNALIFADKTKAKVGEEIEITASISEPFGTTDMPFYDNEKIDYLYGPLKMAAFDGGKTTEIDPSISGTKDGQRKKLSYEEIEAAFLKEKKANPDAPAWSLMTRVFNSNIGTYKIASEGTVTLVGVSSYGKGTVVKNIMKTFVNLKADGESTKARSSHFNFNGVELLPVEDLANVKPGGTVKVQALLNGKPQSGIIVYSGVKDLPESERIASVSSYTILTDPIYSSAISDKDGIVVLKLPELPKGATEMRDVYLFTDGHLVIAPHKVRYRSTITFNISE